MLWLSGPVERWRAFRESDPSAKSIASPLCATKEFTFMGASLMRTQYDDVKRKTKKTVRSKRRWYLLCYVSAGDR